jgi:hypothetical protein
LGVFSEQISKELGGLFAAVDFLIPKKEKDRVIVEIIVIIDVVRFI